MTFQPLKNGDTIGVFSPSSFVEQDALEEGIIFLEEQGLKVFVHPQTFARHKQSAGTIDQKVKAIDELYKNPDIKAVIASIGGNRALHTLPHIDFDIIKENPKPLIGFSDVTALLNAFYAKTKQVQIHAPVLKHLKDNQNSKMLIEFLKTGKTHYDLDDVEIVKEGDAEGIVVGGNLSLIHNMIGLDEFPDIEGKILFLEDINEQTSHLDRAFCHLKQLGIFNKVSGLILGSFDDLKDTGERAFGFSFEEIVYEHTGHLNIPVIMNAPFGHGDHNYALPIGMNASLNAKKEKISLKYL